MKVLITGSTGFVGLKLCQLMLSRGITVLATVRSEAQAKKLPYGAIALVVKNIDGETNWENLPKGIDAVVHLAARVHIKKETSQDPIKEFRSINTEGTTTLALSAARSGVGRFVFMSTIGVNGKVSGDKPFKETDIPVPHNMYSISKREAEINLEVIGKEHSMEIVCVRSPLLYGAGDPGNFHTLLKAVDLGVPLPIRGIKNKKSFLYVGNLVDALLACTVNPKAKGTYIVSDGKDVSTAEMVELIAKELNRPANLFSFPLWLTRIIAKSMGQLSSFDQLISTLVVDSSKIKNELNWTPPYEMEEGVKETIKWYQNRD